MDNVLQRLAGCLLCACFLFLTSLRLMGALQQAGYQNKSFLAWFGRKDNLQKARLALWAGMAFASCAVFGVCFSFLGETAALMLQAVPFVLFCILYLVAEKKYALKVPLKRTGRIVRLSSLYVLFLLCFAYIFVAILNFIRVAVNLPAYTLFAYTPFALFIYLTPYILCLANACESVFENARNKKFVKRAGQVLDESKIIKVGIVGSYAKTSVKVILASMLSKKYKVLATPASFNTPLGISICVNKLKSSHQVFIAEMGARNGGNIRELCDIVEPQYGIITGIANQHLETFFSIENIIKTKCELADSLKKRNGFLIINSDTKHLEDVIQRVDTEYQLCGVGADKRNSLFIRNVVVTNNGSEFDLVVDGESYNCKTRILGVHNISNIAVSAGLALKLGVDIRDIVSAISELEPPAHRLELVKTSNGMVILDDTFNANIEGATAALETLSLFDGRKVIVTPGLVELGVEEKQANKEFGKKIAHICELVVLIGKTRSEPIKKGLLEEGFDPEKILVFNSLDGAKKEFKRFLTPKDAVLLENDLPDDYNEIDELA